MSFKKIIIILNRFRNRQGKFPELEKALFAKLISRSKYGLYRSMPALQNLAENIAKQLNIRKFKASRHWVYGFARRHNLRFKKITTDKQQTIHSYLIVWTDWIVCLRKYCINVGLVTPRGFIKSFRLWNCDEFALEPSAQQLMHLSGEGCMTNAQQLKLTVSTTKRYCTITGIVPKSGFPIECLVHMSVFVIKI